MGCMYIILISVHGPVADTYSKFLVEQVLSEQLLVRIAWIGPNLDPHFLCTFRGSKPMLFFDWWPNSLSNLDEFMPVSFPSCISFHGENSYLCNYELHTLKKFIWSELLDSAKVAVEVINTVSWIFSSSHVQLLIYPFHVYKNFIERTSKRTAFNMMNLILGSQTILPERGGLPGAIGPVHRAYHKLWQQLFHGSSASQSDYGGSGL